MNEIILFLLLGLIAGIMGGILGLGGGIIIIPALIYIFGLSQHQAQGTTLAIMIPPIGILAAYEYYKHGYINIKIAIFIALGFFIGGFIGGKIAIIMSETLLKKIFGVMMIILAVKMIFFE